MTTDGTAPKLALARALPLSALALSLTACGRPSLDPVDPGSATPREPRVLVVDPATQRFVAYGRDGQIVHDYLAHLDFGSGFAGRHITADSYALSWDGTTAWTPTVGSPPPGLSEPLLGSRIVMRAENTTTGKVKVKVLTMAGAVESAFTLDGDWNGFALSPARKFIYATSHVQDPDSQIAALVRPSDGTILWQAHISYGMFARDDSHLVYHPVGRPDAPPRIRNLATGAEISPALTQEPFLGDPNMGINAHAPLPGRMVMLAAGSLLESRLLYQMDWAGNIRRFGFETPSATEEYLLAADPAGERAIWTASTNNEDMWGNYLGSTHRGTWELTLASNQVTPWNGTDTACLGRPAAKTFRLSGGVLESCSCGDGTCVTIATPPVPGPGWTPGLIADPGGRVAMVTLVSGSPQNLSYGDTRCYSATGQLLATLPSGAVVLNATAQIVLLTAGPGTANAWQTAIVDLASGQIHWLGEVAGAVIVHE